MVARDLNLIIGSNIKKIRTLAGMKGETLALELGVTKSAISQMENGLVDIRVSTLFKISDIFKIEIYDLITHSESTAGVAQSTKVEALIEVVSELVTSIKIKKTITYILAIAIDIAPTTFCIS